MAKKQGFLGKAIGALVQVESAEEPAPELTPEELEAMAAATSPPAATVEVDSSQIDAADVIRSIYEQGDFNEETSLFRLDGFISSLPKEMPTETKQGSIAGILKYSGIDIDTLIDDGQRRLAILLAAQSRLKEDNAQREAQMSEEIEQLKRAIQEAERRISEDKSTTEQSSNAIDAETVKLKALLDFASGVAIANNK